MTRAAGANQYCVLHVGAAMTRDSSLQSSCRSESLRMPLALTMCRTGARRGVLAVGGGA